MLILFLKMAESLSSSENFGDFSIWIPSTSMASATMNMTTIMLNFEVHEILKHQKKK